MCHLEFSTPLLPNFTQLQQFWAISPQKRDFGILTAATEVLLDAPCSGESLTRRGEAEALAPKPQYVEGLRPGRTSEVEGAGGERILFFLFGGYLFEVSLRRGTNRKTAIYKVLLF